MDKLSKIKEFISLSPQGTLFTSPEWLKAVAPNRWDYIILGSSDSIQACLPIVHYEKFGFKIIKMPPLTQTLGLLLPPDDGKYVEKLSRINNLFLDFISLIPKRSFFSQRFHPTIENWLPFYWNGYTQTTRYTYIIKNLSDLDKIWKGMRPNIRREIRKAKKQLKVESGQDFESLKQCIFSTYKRKDKGNPFPFKTLERVVETCVELNCGRIFKAQNEKDETCGAVYVVWDQKSAYYIAGGSPGHRRKTGAMSLLLWEAIQYSSRVTHQFNFEGSMIKSIERFFRAFGGVQVPYFEISKTNSFFITLSKLF